MQTPSDDEPTLVGKARGGDVHAYEELIRRYQGVAFRTACLVLRDPSDAEDVVQEAFVKAFGALHRFDERRPLRPWLLRIVTNEARNARKAAQRRDNLSTRYAATQSQGRGDPSVEQTAIETERHEKLLAALDSLKDDERLIISLRYFLELSEQEMAEVLRCRHGTVKSRLSRAMARLRRVIQERFPGLEATYEF
ncbi:MAG: RNA polymerase sigma factor [Chloroflexi bacterium]|nr:RNA polymerase sigma factor [Chloroflexota bacterium]